MKLILPTSLLFFLPMLASADAVEIDGIWYNLIPKAKVSEVIKGGYYSRETNIPEQVTYDNTSYTIICCCR